MHMIVTDFQCTTTAQAMYDLKEQACSTSTSLWNRLSEKKEKVQHQSDITSLPTKRDTMRPLENRFCDTSKAAELHSEVTLIRSIHST